MFCRRVGYGSFDPSMPPFPAPHFAFLACCWGRWRWLKSCGSAVLLPSEHITPQHPVCQGCTPVLAWTPWVPGTDLHPGSPKACPCKVGSATSCQRHSWVTQAGPQAVAVGSYLHPGKVHGHRLSLLNTVFQYLFSFFMSVLMFSDISPSSSLCAPKGKCH